MHLPTLKEHASYNIADLISVVFSGFLLPIMLCRTASHMGKS